MAILGTPFKLTYWAKNGKSGVTSITSKIIRPDGNIVGPLIMTELVDNSFKGAYTATYSPLETDPEGNYIVVINSPNEDSHRAFKTVYFEKKTVIDISGLDIAINRRQAIEATTESKLRVDGFAQSKSIAASFEKSNSLEAYFYKDDIEYFLDSNEIIGEI